MKQITITLVSEDPLDVATQLQSLSTEIYMAGMLRRVYGRNNNGRFVGANHFEDSEIVSHRIRIDMTNIDDSDGTSKSADPIKPNKPAGAASTPKYVDKEYIDSSW